VAYLLNLTTLASGGTSIESGFAGSRGRGARFTLRTDEVLHMKTSRKRLWLLGIPVLAAAAAGPCPTS